MNEFREEPDFGAGVPDPGLLPEVSIGAEGDDDTDQAPDIHPFDTDTSAIGCGLDPEDAATDYTTEDRLEVRPPETIDLTEEIPGVPSEARPDAGRPADIDHIRALHYAIRATTLAHAEAPSEQQEPQDDVTSTTYERPLDAELVPEPVQEAMDTVAPPYDEARITYTQRTTLTADSSGDQATSLQLERNETIPGAITAGRTTEVRYDVSRRTGQTEQGLPAAHYEMTRTVAVTDVLGVRPDTPPLVARAGDTPLGPDEVRIENPEAREVIDHLTSQHEADVPADTDVPSRGHELAGEPIEVTWDHYAGETDPSVTLTIGGKLGSRNIAEYGGTLIAPDSPTYDRPGLAHGPLYVHPEFREAGLANRLVAGMAKIAIENGMETMHGPVDSPHTIRAFRRIASEAALHFRDQDLTTLEYIELPMTSDQAIASLELAEEKNVPDSRRSISFVIDTAGINRDMLESPVHITPPLGPRPQEEADRDHAI